MSKVKDVERKELLKELKRSVLKQILTSEIDIRYLEREKIKVTTEQLIKVEEAIKNSKDFKNALEAKLEVLQDDLDGK